MDFQNRYSKQINLKEIGEQGQQKLQKSRILIVGMGGLGCPAAQYLVTAGVGTIGLLDFDLVDESNLQRQVLYSEEDIGKPKTEAAKSRLSKMNSSVIFEIFNERLTLTNAKETFERFDIIVDGTDNFESKYLINDVCATLKIPWVHGAIHQFQGQLAVFHQEGSTYRCLYPTTPKQASNCDESGVLGSVAGVIGTMQANECLKLLLGIGHVLKNQLFFADFLQLKFQTFQISPTEKGRQSSHFLNVKENTGDFSMIHLPKESIYLDVRNWFENPRVQQENVLQIPMDELTKRAYEIPKNQEVIVFCQSGKRSEQAVRLLTEKFGFNNLIHMKEGVETIAI